MQQKIESHWQIKHFKMATLYLYLRFPSECMGSLVTWAYFTSVMSIPVSSLTSLTAHSCHDSISSKWPPGNDRVPAPWLPFVFPSNKENDHEFNDDEIDATNYDDDDEIAPVAVWISLFWVYLCEYLQIHGPSSLDRRPGHQLQHEHLLVEIDSFCYVI